MKNFIGSLLLLLSVAYSAFCQKQTLVHNEQEFAQASATAKPGDVITIANGTYKPWAIKFNASGAPKQPINIRAQTDGKVIFTGEVTQPVFKIKGAYVQLSGISFTECALNKANGKAGILIELDSTQKCLISNCSFERNVAKVQYMALIIVGGNGQYNRVEHCRFNGNIDDQDVQVKVTKETCPQFTLIADNIFTNKTRVHWANDNGGECIQVGQDPILLGNMVANTIVTHNRFIACSAEPEVVSNKSSGNFYRANYFENCDAELVMRGGHNCQIDSNRFVGGKGIRVNGSGHRIIGNIITNVSTGIRLNYGMAKGRTDTGFYIAATDCKIKDNTITNAQIGILVGDGKNEDWTGKFDTKRYPSRVMQDVAPANNEIADNKFDRTGQNVVYQ